MNGRRRGALVGGLLLAGCARATTHPLQPVTGPVQVGELALVSTASVLHRPTVGYDLQVTLELTWRGQDPLRVDLARTMVRVDGLSWSPCHFPADFDQARLIRTLDPGEVFRVDFTCEDIARPGASVELRVLTSGAGGTGVTELRFAGL
ncbi:MAG: hypothetical protein D6798_06855 [Deltaproteobacteria bacterium]|nr:MAG: hypothetical protein D6798_06855 [Deltaproteobacteria bacterium]